MFYTIYLIRNLINRKVYLGKHQTTNIEDGYLGSGKHLKSSIRKYGKDNFKKDILYICSSEEEMNWIEKELVTEDWCKSTKTYNICEGGKGGFSYINQLPETQSRLKKHLLYMSKKGVEKLIWLKENDSKWLSELKLKQSALRKGKPNGLLGKKATKETKQKLSKAKIGHSNQSGIKNSQYGKPRSEETKQKIRETLKRNMSL